MLTQEALPKRLGMEFVTSRNTTVPFLDLAEFYGAYPEQPGTVPEQPGMAWNSLRTLV